MIIIGELINASRKVIKTAIEAQDADAIRKLAKEQAEAGADYIDVNAGVFVDQVFSLLAPCGPGASVISVRHRIYAHDH